MENITQEYHGSKIYFDEKTEEWCVTFDGHTNKNKSLQLVKNFIDRRNKNDFKRIPVYLEDGNYYHDSSYKKATITSMGLDGRLYVVKDGEKSASVVWGAIIQNEENEKKIAEILEIQKQSEQLKERRQKLVSSLKKVDTDAIKKKVLGIK